MTNSFNFGNVNANVAGFDATIFGQPASFRIAYALGSPIPINNGTFTGIWRLSAGGGGHDVAFTVTNTAVPEPSTIALLGLGLGALGLGYYRRGKKTS